MKLTSIRIRNFKAIQDSGTIKLGPLTAFVGYNGTGKSSVIEACEFFQTYALRGLNAAVQPWYGFENVLWQGKERKWKSGDEFFPSPLQVELGGKLARPKTAWKANLDVAEQVVVAGENPGRAVTVKREYLKVGGRREEFDPKQRGRGRPRTTSQLFDLDWAPNFRQWLFISLNPHEIGQPRRRQENIGVEPLDKTGANLADILKSFLDKEPEGFNAMIEALQYIVPYAANVRPDITQDMVERRSLIQLTERFTKERNVTLPGWVLSGGTLRLLALLAALRHPEGPSVLFIEELENGLDPRAIGFLVDEIRSAVTSGGKQVILTTHSSYLLDKLSLEHIITVERAADGPPTFQRPVQEKELREWAKKFAPGSLYSMGMLRSKDRRVR